MEHFALNVEVGCSIRKVVMRFVLNVAAHQKVI